MTASSDSISSPRISLTPSPPEQNPDLSEYRKDEYHIDQG
jgi:hypothetical protein